MKRKGSKNRKVQYDLDRYLLPLNDHTCDVEPLCLAEDSSASSGCHHDGHETCGRALAYRNEEMPPQTGNQTTTPTPQPVSQCLSEKPRMHLKVIMKRNVYVFASDVFVHLAKGSQTA